MKKACMDRIVFGAAALLSLAGASFGQTTERISVGNAGVQGPGPSYGGWATPNGRYVAFTSASNTLTPNDNNTGADVFVRDRWTGTTSRVSIPDLSTGHTDANAACSTSGTRCISDDGRFVVFSSNANNLVTGDNNQLDDIFVRDRDLDGNGVFDEPGSGRTRTTRVNLTPNEGAAFDGCPNQTCSHHSYAPCISGNGRRVAWSSTFNFTSESVPFSNIYVRDRDPDADGIMDESNATTVLATPEISCVGCAHNGGSYDPFLSSNGRFVAFTSDSSRIVFSDFNQARDAFVRDLALSSTVRVSLAGDETEGQPNRDVVGRVGISDNGRFVVFASGNNDLGQQDDAPADTNDAIDVFVRDRDPNANGVFDEAAPPDPEVPNVPQTESVTEVASLGRGINFQTLQLVPRRLNSHSLNPAISGSGRYVAFASDADNYFCGLLGCNDSNSERDVFVRDRELNSTTLVSMSHTEEPADGDSDNPFIANDGASVGFASVATNLRGSDTNGSTRDVYLRAGVYVPENDGCGTTTQVQSGVYHGDTSGATPTGASTCGSSADSPDVVFSYYSGCDGQIVIDTRGSGYDTVLSVHSACPADTTTQIACNDDFADYGLASSVTVNVQSGSIYMIRVTGYNGSAGPFTLNISECVPICGCDWNGDTLLNSQDFFDFLTAFFAGNADYNQNSVTNSQDFFDFLTCFFKGC